MTSVCGHSSKATAHVLMRLTITWYTLTTSGVGELVSSPVNVDILHSTFSGQRRSVSTDRYIEVVSSQTVVNHAPSVVVGIVDHTPARLEHIRLEQCAGCLCLQFLLQQNIWNAINFLHLLSSCDKATNWK